MLDDVGPSPAPEIPALVIVSVIMLVIEIVDINPEKLPVEHSRVDPRADNAETVSDIVKISTYVNAGPEEDKDDDIVVL